MLAAGAAERHHQALEAATLIIAHAGIHQRHHAGEKLMHALLLIEIVDHRRVFAREGLEALFASGIRETASVENEPAAMPGLVFREGPVKRKTENPEDEVFCFGSQALQFLRGQHASEGVHQRWQRDRELDVVKEPAQVFKRVRHALQKMSFAFIKSAKTIGAERLHA